MTWNVTYFTEDIQRIIHLGFSQMFHSYSEWDSCWNILKNTANNPGIFQTGLLWEYFYYSRHIPNIFQLGLNPNASCDRPPRSPHHHCQMGFLWYDMNNPWSKCQNWFQFLESAGSRQTVSDDDNFKITNDNNDSASTNSHYQVHPNSSFIFGTGSGFMDQFNSGLCANMWNENIYHSFSSKDEWGFAAWLSSSGLSMRAIDELLALPIVSLLFFVCFVTHSDWMRRSRNCHSPL